MNKKLIFGAAAAVIALALFIRSENQRLEQRLAGQIDAAKSQIGENQAALLARLEKIEQTVARLQPVDTADPGAVSPSRSNVQHSIKPGLYVLDRKIRMRNTAGNGYYDGDFTIYHIKAALSEDAADNKSEINIGLAVGDITTPPVFYLDYNDDNKVDADMMRDFASIGPLGPLLRRGISERNSQAAYNEFLDHHETASYTSLSDIEQSGQSIATSLWKFVKDQSSGMLDWISTNDPTSATPKPADSASGPAGN